MLNLEYLPDANDGRPLLRLFGYDTTDVASLQELCIALAEGRSLDVPLESQPWVNAIGECCLTLRLGLANRGVAARIDGIPLVMEYAADGWLEVADKLDPFVGGSLGFQWLTNEGDVDVLISPDGRW